MEIVAYTTPGCFYCDQLKELFSRAEVSYDVIMVETEQEKTKFRSDFPSAMGFPFVVIDGEEYPGLVPVAKLFVEKGLVSPKQK
jgi:glutaredoxin